MNLRSVARLYLLAGPSADNQGTPDLRLVGRQLDYALDKRAEAARRERRDADAALLKRLAARLQKHTHPALAAMALPLLEAFAAQFPTDSHIEAKLHELFQAEFGTPADAAKAAPE